MRRPSLWAADIPAEGRTSLHTSQTNTESQRMLTAYLFRL